MKQTKWKSVRPQNKSSKKMSKRRIWTVFVALMLVTIFGSGLAYYFYQKSMPEKLLADAIAHMFETVTEENFNIDSGTFIYETHDSSKPIKIRVNFKATTNKADGHVDADVGIEYSGHTYKLNVLLATFSQDEMYIKLNSLSTFVQQLVTNNPELAAYTGYIRPITYKLEDTWIKVTGADLQQLSGTHAYALKQCNEALNNLKVMPEDSARIKKIFLNNQFVMSSGTPKSEKVGNEPVLRYTLNFNNSATQNFINQVADLKSFAAVKKDCQLSQKNVEKSITGTPGLSASNQFNPTIELWVGTQSRRILKIHLGSKNKTEKVTFTSGFTDVVKTKSIKKPESSVPVTELKSLFNVFLPPRQ